MFQPLDMTGKKILITGASSGIGQATAIYLSNLGSDLVLIGRNREKLEDTEKLLSNGHHQILTLDLTDLSDASNIIKSSMQDGKKYNGFIHCAGIGHLVPLKALTLSHVQETMQVNFYSFLEIAKNITSKKYFDYGGIVAISSFAAQDGGPGQIAYSASKAALDASIQILAQELATRNIRVNSIRPGMIETNATENYKSIMSREHYEALISKQLLGIGSPDDVAAMCAFLLSDASKFITGRMFYVDGGRFN